MGKTMVLRDSGAADKTGKEVITMNVRTVVTGEEEGGCDRET